MELLTPGYGLIVWQMLALLGSLLFLISWVMIFTAKNLNTTERLIWMLGTLLLPIVGPVLFLMKQLTAKTISDRSR